ncbi:basic proline-rich protein-like [Ursus americanus]|uniref:basic proline-rich protein-like n=1 Tax=Ursus americanus TaxID=9643 RepID=UPI001E67A16F|nr:basic proline-rich protein-like [Ursus americanus]
MRFTPPVIPSHPSAPASSRRPSPEPVRHFPSRQAPRHRAAFPRSLLSPHFPEPRLVREGSTKGAESPPAPATSCTPPGTDGSGPGRALAPRRLAAPRSPALQPQLRFYQTYSKVGPKWRRRSRGRAPRRLSAPPTGGRVVRGPPWAGGAARCGRPPRSPRAPLPSPLSACPLPGPGAECIPPPAATPASAGARFCRAETRPDFPRRPDGARGPRAAAPAAGQ